MPRTPQAPSFDDLVADLKVVRKNGITKLRDLDLPALSQAARASGEVDPGESVSAPAIESMLRRAVQDLDGEPLDIIAGLIFQLTPGTRGYKPSEARRYAADEVGKNIETFRHSHEKRAISQVAEMILIRIHAHQMRLARLEGERRTPNTTRLAVKWLERFEAYHRLWTPIYGLGADLTAYRSTLLDPDRPYDRVDEEGEASYTQEYQAEGYVRFALFFFSSFLEHLRQFMVSHGGLWLFSDEPAGLEVSDAVYRIGWHSPNNERDDSVLRTLYREADGELDGFLDRLKISKVGESIHDDWQQWAGRCECTWNLEAAEGHFPTRLTYPGIKQDCAVHLMVEACGDYCRLVEEDWFRIQDWYSIDRKPETGISAEQLYSQYPRRP